MVRKGARRVKEPDKRGLRGPVRRLPVRGPTADAYVIPKKNSSPCTGRRREPLIFTYI